MFGGFGSIRCSQLMAAGQLGVSLYVLKKKRFFFIGINFDACFLVGFV